MPAEGRQIHKVPMERKRNRPIDHKYAPIGAFREIPQALAKRDQYNASRREADTQRAVLVAASKMRTRQEQAGFYFLLFREQFLIDQLRLRQ